MDEQAGELLKSLAGDVAEAASYLRELGVEGLEGLSAEALAPHAAARAEPAKKQAPVPPALRLFCQTHLPPVTL